MLLQTKIIRILVPRIMNFTSGFLNRHHFLRHSIFGFSVIKLIFIIKVYFFFVVWPHIFKMLSINIMITKLCLLTIMAIKTRPVWLSSSSDNSRNSVFPAEIILRSSFLSTIIHSVILQQTFSLTCKLLCCYYLTKTQTHFMDHFQDNPLPSVR